MADGLRRFYEGLMTMVRDGAPATAIAHKIRRAVPDRESHKKILGHLRDSRNAFEAEGQEEAAELLDRVIEELETPESG